jgi:hypothetical protein
MTFNIFMVYMISQKDKVSGGGSHGQKYKSKAGSTRDHTWTKKEMENEWLELMLELCWRTLAHQLPLKGILLRYQAFWNIRASS